jgi:DNA-binding response OmpR family regulator
MERSKLKGRTVLVVEDEPLIALDIALVFRNAGAEVTTTSTLKQALILVEHDGLAVAIVDHSLNEGDTTGLRARLKEKDIPFVVYSGFPGIMSADGRFVEKPARADVLLATVEALLPSGPDKT